MASPTVADLLARHPSLESEPQARLETLLADATAYVAELVDTLPSDSVLNPIVCNMVARTIRPDSLAGVQQESWGASPYSGSVTYANPAGNFYLTSFEKDVLGIEGDDMEAVWAVPGGLAEESDV